MSVSTSLLNNAAAVYGDPAIAAFAIVSRCLNFVNSTVVGFGQGFQPVASFNYQARKYDRVKKGLVFTMCFGLVFIGSFSVISMICAEGIIGIFQKSEAVIAIGSTALRYTATGMLFVPFSVPVNMLYQSIQQTMIDALDRGTKVCLFSATNGFSPKISTTAGPPNCPICSFQCS